MMRPGINNIAIINRTNVDYFGIIYGISKSDAIFVTKFYTWWLLIVFQRNQKLLFGLSNREKK